MKFWKMNGAGNDFIVIDNRDGTVDAAQWPRIARTLCERHLSIGADGLMIEVHNDPAHALSDGAQSLTYDSFHHTMNALRAVAAAVDREI